MGYGTYSSCAADRLMSARRLAIILPTLIGISAFAMIAAMASGSVGIPLSDTIGILFGDTAHPHYAIVWELRLPRAATAFVAGGLLAIAGALMQVLLRNPLADPYVLGISGGAAAAALAALLLGLGSAWISGSALAGALFSMFQIGRASCRGRV